MTKKELLAKNPKLVKLDQIITERANTPKARKAVEEFIATNFGASATLDEIIDLFEYYDIMTNDVTLVGSKFFDSTVFEPIKELAIGYRKDLEDVTNGLVKREAIFKKVVANASSLKKAYNEELYKRVRSEKEAYALLEKVAGLEKEIEDKDKLLGATVLSDRQKAEHVVKAEEDAEHAKKVAEDAVAKSKEFEDGLNALKADLEKSNKANAASQKELDKKDDKIAELSKKITGKNIKIGVLIAAFGVSALTLIGHEIYHHTKEESSPQSEIIIDRADDLRHKVSAQNEELLQIGENIYMILSYGRDALQDSMETLDKEKEYTFVQDAYDKASEAYNFAEETLGKISESIEGLKANQEGIETADFDGLLDYMDKTADYVHTMSGYISDAGKAFGDMKYAYEVAYGSASESRETIKAEYDALMAKVDTFIADINTTLGSESEDLGQVSDAVVTFKEEADERYNYAVSQTEELVGHILDSIDYSYSDTYVEDGAIKTAKGDVYLSEQGKEEYAHYAATGEDARITTASILDLPNEIIIAEYLVDVMAESYSHQDEDTHTQGNENGGESTEVADENDDGKTPADGSGAESGEVPTPPVEEENENGDGNTTTGAEISDGEQEPGEEEPAEVSFGNGGDLD